MELFTHLVSCKKRHLAPSFEKSSPEAVNRNCAMSGKAELLICTPSGCASSSSCRHRSVEHGNQLAHSSHQFCPPTHLRCLQHQRSHHFHRVIPFHCDSDGWDPTWHLVSSDAPFSSCVEVGGVILELFCAVLLVRPSPSLHGCTFQG